jgi:hypothetical protein
LGARVLAPVQGSATRSEVCSLVVSTIEPFAERRLVHPPHRTGLHRRSQCLRTRVPMPARPIVRRALTHQCEAMAANLRMDFPTKEAQP